ncbi:MAG: pentapeptide repeat-containing protein [Pseudomonadota bacterium]
MGSGNDETAAPKSQSAVTRAMWLEEWRAWRAWQKALSGRARSFLAIRVRAHLLALVSGNTAEERLERFFFRAFITALVLAIAGLVLANFGVWQPFGGELGNSEKLLRDAETSREKSEILRNLFFAAAGLVGAVGGLFQLHNSAKRTRINSEQSATADKQRQINYEAERNDRFVKASELLKSESEAVQIAGIYALQRLAEESEAEYREIVIRVLAGFVRTMTGPEGRAQRAITQLQEAAKVLETGGASLRDESPSGRDERPGEAVNAAMDALMTLTDPEKGGEGLGHLVDLRRCRLVGLDQPVRQMIGWRLDGADFTRANLGRAYLGRAYLGGANLGGANLGGAYLGGANLGGANLGGANLGGANLRSAKLEDAKLEDANLGVANLGGANLRGAYLRSAKLEGAKLEGANLGGANLGGVTLDLTRGVKTEQLAQALYVTWPDHVPRPKEGKYSEAWEAGQAASEKAASSTDGSEGEPEGPEAL